MHGTRGAGAEGRGMGRGMGRGGGGGATAEYAGGYLTVSCQLSSSVEDGSIIIAASN